MTGGAAWYCNGEHAGLTWPWPLTACAWSADEAVRVKLQSFEEGQQ
jgi:hypothetical protein